ncbi:hypothetical protein [Micromonospora zhanjiangensis]|uniref:Uncharacterized protein n=1 Tax=Micromonospora zhanjiangensis TaxID=1522057 RepID=A0ABV8KPZ1_9ACTN
MSPTPLADDPDQPDSDQPDPTPSQQDLDDADFVLFAHPPKAIAKLVCACGDDYPCDEVRFAQLVKEGL